jgi:hypothetical protein
MNIRSAQIKPGMPSKQQEIVWRFPQPSGVLIFAVAMVLVATAASALNRPPETPQATQSKPIENVKCVIGLENVKPNAKGTLSVQPNGLEFATGKTKANISPASILDIFAGQESRQDVSGPLGTAAKAGIPYGGGRVVSLFSHIVEVLTVEYEDTNGGFHGAIFVLGEGKATAVKDQLVANGAKVAPHVQAPQQQEQKP